MIAAQKLGDADECGVRVGPFRIGGDRRLAGNVRQHLPAALVGAQVAWCAAEADVFEMIEQRLRCLTGRAARATNRVPDARDPSDVRRSAGQHYLVRVRRLDRHDNSSRRSARAVWVIKSVTKPPRTAARTAGAFEVP